jgi:hypothetical protein
MKINKSISNRSVCGDDLKARDPLRMQGALLKDASVLAMIHGAAINTNEMNYQ